MRPEIVFRRLHFWGSEFLPGDLVLSLDNIRAWARQEGLLTDAEQTITESRVLALQSGFTGNDDVGIVVHVRKEPTTGRLTYSEEFHVPVKTLIAKNTDVVVEHWELGPKSWDAEGRVLSYGEARIAFHYLELKEELLVLATGRLVVEEFTKWTSGLPPHYPRRQLPRGVLRVKVNGHVTARFVKVGRLHRVHLSLVRDEP